MRVLLGFSLSLLLVACEPPACPEVQCEDAVFVALDPAPPIIGIYSVTVITDGQTQRFFCVDGIVDGEGAVSCDSQGFRLPGRPETVEVQVTAGEMTGEHRFEALEYNEVKAGEATCPVLCVHAELTVVLR